MLRKKSIKLLLLVFACFLFNVTSIALGLDSWMIKENAVMQHVNQGVGDANTSYYHHLSSGQELKINQDGEVLVFLDYELIEYFVDGKGEVIIPSKKSNYLLEIWSNSKILFSNITPKEITNLKSHTNLKRRNYTKTYTFMFFIILVLLLLILRLRMIYFTNHKWILKNVEYLIIIFILLYLSVFWFSYLEKPLFNSFLLIVSIFITKFLFYGFFKYLFQHKSNSNELLNTYFKLIFTASIAFFVCFTIVISCDFSFFKFDLFLGSIVLSSICFVSLLTYKLRKSKLKYLFYYICAFEIIPQLILVGFL